MRLKKLLFMMILLTIAGRASSQVSFSVNPVSINAGGTQDVNINVSITGTYLACQFELLLPEGLSILSDEYGYYADFKPVNSRAEDHGLAVSNPSTNLYRFVVSSNNNKTFVTGNNRSFVSLTLVADANASSSTKVAKIQNALFSISNTQGEGADDLEFNITVAGKPTVTADNKSRAYGDANPELTYTVSGGTITGTPTLSTTATQTSNVGEYPITVGANDEYNTAPGTLTVTAAPLTISGGTYTIKQGEALPTFAAVYTGFMNDETSTVLTSQPVLTLEDGVTGASAPGSYTITVSGGEATNYAITRENGTLTITAADPVTVTAKSYTITYGDALPDYGYTTEGADLSGVPEISCTATATSGAGTYPITITKGTVSNYNVTYVNGTLTINKAPLTIKADEKSKTYGDANPDFTCAYSGFVKEETSAVLATQPTLATEATVASGVGTYDITASGAVAANYEISYTKGTLTVNKATLTAKAKDASVKQGEATPALEIEYSGWKNSDGVSALTTSPTASTERTLASEPNTYPITVAGGEDDNYEFAYVPGTLTVTEADPVTVTAKSYTIKYGDNIPNFEYTSTGATLNGTPAVTCEATKTSTVGTYAINIAKGSVTNYNTTFVPGTLTIEPAPLTAKAKDVTVEQGVATPTLEIEYTGFKNNETEDVLTTKPTVTTTREVSSDPGTYPITLTGGSATNYAIALENGTLTVTQPGLITVTVTNTERYYGDENPTFQYTVTGGELVGEPELSCTATKASIPGEYDITIGMGTITNYNVSLVGGKLTVKKAPLTITAENKSKTYGEANPTFTYTCGGLKNDETESVLTTVPTLSTTADATSNVGKYDITAEGAVAANYEISYAKGTLTVTPKTIALNISLSPDPATYTYDVNVKQPTVGVSATGVSSLTTGVDYTLSGTLSETIAGNYTITATPKGNYTGSAVSANWTINASTSEDAAGNKIVEDGVNVTLTQVGENAVGEDGGLTIPSNVTKISANAFDNMTAAEKSAVLFVDLSNSNVSGLTVNRNSGVFSGFSENTLIYLSAGNYDGNEPNVVIGSTCKELKLTDEAPQSIPVGFTANKVSYARTLVANDVYTMCLPYSLTSDNNLAFFELSGVSNSTLIFNEVTTTEANKPYLAVPKAAGALFSRQVSTAISSNSNTGEMSVSGYKMLGTMKRIGRDEALGAYILQDNNEWRPITTDSPATVCIPAYRGYIKATTETAHARMQTVLRDSDDATGILNIQTFDAEGNEKWYDMNGRRLPGKPVGKGAYIVNGKKVLTK